MSKVSMSVSNDFCPQTLFLYGTYKEDGTPNFGLFCWISYCWDGGLGVMAAIGGDKLTRDRIRANGVFSANLVTEDILPLADYLGNTEGYSGDKTRLPVDTIKGACLDVPVLESSPLAFELEVSRSIPLEGSEVFICRIKNVLADAELADQNKSIAEKMLAIAPVRTTCSTYFSWDGSPMGRWGEPMKDALT